MSDQGPTLGKLPLSAFGCTALPDCDNDIVEGLRSLPDLTGMISDAMDLLGLEGAVSKRRAQASSFGRPRGWSGHHCKECSAQR